MRSSCALWVYAASWAVMILPPHRCHLLSLLCGVWNAGQHIPSVSHAPCSAVVTNNLTAHSPLLLAWLLLSILALLRLAATATLSPLLLLHWQVLIRVIVDKLIHISSFLTLQTEENHSCCIKSSSEFADISATSAITHTSSTAAFLLFFGHFLRSICKGEQVLGLLHIQRSLLQELLLFLQLSVPLFFLTRCNNDKSLSKVSYNQNVFWVSKTWEDHMYLFFHHLLTQQIPLLFLFGAELLLLFILLSGSCYVVLSLT